MNPLFYGPLLEFGKLILNRFGPEDKEEKAKVETEFLKMAMTGELSQIIEQLKINAIEAAHPSIWVSGWRPFYGWAGGVGFLYAVFFQPILSWVAEIQKWPTPPTLENELLWVVVTGLLGIGGLRTYEKKAKVAK